MHRVRVVRVCRARVKVVRVQRVRVSASLTAEMVAVFFIS